MQIKAPSDNGESNWKLSSVGTWFGSNCVVFFLPGSLFFFFFSNVDQADLRGPSDADANKQEQHVNDESQIRNGIHPRGSDQDKARDNSRDDGYPKHGNVPLRDSNQDLRIADKEPVTQVTSPVKNNAMNKWSDILKVNTTQCPLCSNDTN